MSFYKQGGKLKVQRTEDPKIWEAAQKLAEGWLPQKVCVMDIAKRPDGSWCIVEFNGAHGSGLYDIDIQQLTIGLSMAL